MTTATKNDNIDNNNNNKDNNVNCPPPPSRDIAQDERGVETVVGRNARKSKKTQRETPGRGFASAGVMARYRCCMSRDS